VNLNRACNWAATRSDAISLNYNWDRARADDGRSCAIVGGTLFIIMRKVGAQMPMPPTIIIIITTTTMMMMTIMMKKSDAKAGTIQELTGRRATKNRGHGTHGGVPQGVVHGGFRCQRGVTKLGKTLRFPRAPPRPSSAISSSVAALALGILMVRW
jgi:hypothetical protein